MVADNTSKFKVGDRVRTKGYEGKRWAGEGTIVLIGEYCNIVEIDGDRAGFHDCELELATNDNTPTPTTGFTVPLCAYDDDTVDLTALGRAYLSGWRDAQQALAA